MIGDLLLWFVALLLAGGLAFPLAYCLLPFLPDRGYALSKPLGLLLWGYAYWLLASFHVVQNDIGGVLFGLLVVAALAGFALSRAGWKDLLGWLRAHLRLVIVTEVLFLLAFAGWALVRGTYPDISGTEKPMEIAFINAILHSPAFPPHDPWLSGYAISYYYFGYLIVAMLARFTGIPGEVAFNLALCAWFALAATGAYGVLFNLLAGREPLRALKEKAYALYGALFAPLFLLIMSNLEGVFEVLHAEGLFWTPGAQTSAFWNWLGIQELTSPPVAPYALTPSRPGGIWWWRASRVLQDFDYKGMPREIIDEFPFFSYLLGDLHPHVLSMPFVLLAIGLALHSYLRLKEEGGSFSFTGFFKRPDTWLAAVVLGGLAFLNTWDFPIYLALFVAAFFLAHYQREGWLWSRVADALLLLVALGAAGVLLYLPFYLGFQSQAGGLLPSMIFFTRGTHFWIMFGGLLVPVCAWLAYLWFRQGRLKAFANGLILSAGLITGLWVTSFLLGRFVVERLAGIYNADANTPVFSDALLQRLQSPGTWLTLLLLVTVVWGLLGALRRQESAEFTPQEGDTFRPDSFALLLVLLGAGLALFPEFFYLKDQFGWRMNTIFKFYYQSWVVWSLAAGYAAVVLWRKLRAIPLAAWSVAGAAVIAIALIYPVFGIEDRTNKLNLANWTLDGAAFMQNYSPDDWSAIEWLKSAPQGVVAEAVGGSYTSYARVSEFSGQPAVLGWPGHESQWRGGGEEMGSRESDIENLYKSTSFNQIKQILDKYDIRYVYIGPMERSKYHVNESAFKKNLPVVYSAGQVTIYEAPGYTENSEAGVQ